MRLEHLERLFPESTKQRQRGMLLTCVLPRRVQRRIILFVARRCRRPSAPLVDTLPNACKYADGLAERPSALHEDDPEYVLQPRAHASGTRQIANAARGEHNRQETS